ncbi:MAG: DNA-3-methyladenine glycosylase 2 family protein [Candidatus Marinimicrobia bacterium]|nr:DNA-3-methyladenine glycosylase 2 family protein [Candidatus Neomarinimicrobiota bacterium]
MSLAPPKGDSPKSMRISSGHDAREPIIFEINSEEPLNLDITLSSGQTFRWVKEDSDWWTGFIKGNRVFIRQMKTNNASFRLVCKTSPLVKQKYLIENYFNLNKKYKDIYAIFESDPILKLAIMKYRGLRLISQDPWEMLISFILSSASNIPRIKGNIQRLCEEFGERKFDVFGVYYSFPTRKALASASIKDFKKLGFGFRASYIRETSVKVAEDPGFLSKIGTLPYIEARQELCKLSGVGEKVADCVLLFGYDRLESFPVDTWIKKIVEQYYFNGRGIPTNKLAEFGREKFGIYAGVAQQYLFEYARGMGIK